MNQSIQRIAWRLMLTLALVCGLTFMAGCPSGDCNCNGDGGNGEKLVDVAVEMPTPMFTGTPPILENMKVRVDTKNPETKRAPLQAPADVQVVSRGKPVTSSDDFPMIGDLPLVTDGDKEANEGSYVELAPGKQWVQIDLGEKYEIWGIFLWHYHTSARVYRDTIVQLSDDPEFAQGIITVFNNDHDNSSELGVGEDFEYFDEHVGKLIRVQSKTGRYIRCYSNGNTDNDQNHYVEVEVWGRPAP